MARYVAKDTYDFDETLVKTDDLNVAYKACIQRIEDTDGECEVTIFDMQYSHENGCVVCINFWGDD